MPASLNGGFPLPLPGVPSRVVNARHDRCGNSTAISLPRPVPAMVVRRVVCEYCGERFDVRGAVFEASEVVREPLVAAAVPAPLPPPTPRPLTLPKLPANSIRWIAAPLCLLAVVLGLNSLQGGDESSGTASLGLNPNPARATPGTPAAGAAGSAGAGAKLVAGSSFTLALPRGFQRTTPTGGATFAARSRSKDADATLWVKRDPNLTFKRFEASSLAQLEQLAGSAHVVSRSPSPTADGTVVRLAADAPAGGPAYEVVLRSTGDLYYYLATTLEPNANASTAAGIELIQNSFLPTGVGQ